MQPVLTGKYLQEKRKMSKSPYKATGHEIAV